MYHVLVPDNVHQAALDILENAEDITYTAPGGMAREETLAAIGEADALIIRSSTKADVELLAAAAKLKTIARAGVGVDNIDLAEATKRGIVVMNTPGGNTISTAEHTFGLMLALARHTAQAMAGMQAGRWDRKKYQGVELRNKVLGIIGFGRIGQALAKRAVGFEMQVIAYDAYQNEAMEQQAEAIGVELVDLDTLYAQADFISLHAALTDETRGMINADSIAKMKTGVRIVNAARGALIDDAALAAAIQDGKVAGAAIDVYVSEPPPEDHPLVGLPGVVHTPHLAASTIDAQIAVAVDAAQQTVDALLNAAYQNVVNQDVLAKK